MFKSKTFLQKIFDVAIHESNCFALKRHEKVEGKYFVTNYFYEVTKITNRIKLREILTNRIEITQTSPG